MPNPNTIPWLHYQDIQIPDVELKQKFDIQMASGNFAQAIRLLSNNEAQLKGKAYIADTIAKIVNGILTLENLYGDNVTIFMSDLANKYFALVNNLKFARQWQPTTQYETYNFVLYKDDIYFAFNKPPIGNLPTDETYWIKLTLRGSIGDTGFDVTMKFNWNEETDYSVNDLVVYDGDIWVSRQENLNVIPGTNENIWIKFVTISRAKIYVSNVEPKNPHDNMIWFKVDIDPMAYTGTEPIIGQFQRFVEIQKEWEIMYPNTIFSWVEGTNQFAPIQFVDNITIQPGDWDNQYQWTYQNRNVNIIDSSIVFILPDSQMSNAQKNIYNILALDLANNVIKLTLKEQSRPTVNLPIRIIIR